MKFSESFINCCSVHWNGFFNFFSVLLILPLIFLEPSIEWRTIFLVLWSFVWYMVDVVPVGIIGLLPIIFLPLLGLSPSQEVCMSYARDSQIFFLLSMFIAATMQHSNLAKRYAFSMLNALSCDPKTLLFILMLSAYLLSSFLPDAIVCALMMPLTRALLQILDDISVCKAINEAVILKDDERPYPSKMANAFYIGVAYAVNIGSITTTVASEAGLILRKVTRNGTSIFYSDADLQIQYSIISFPLSLILLLFTIYYLEVMFLGYNRSKSAAAQQSVYDREASRAALKIVGKNLPPFNVHMMLTSVLYFCSWVGFLAISFLNPEINNKVLKYSFGAMMLCFLYFVLPSNFDFCNYFRCTKPTEYKTSSSVLPWAVVNKVTPWKYFFVHGSSVALGMAMKTSGLHLFIGSDFLKMNNLVGQRLSFMALTLVMSIIGSDNFVADLMLNMGVNAVTSNGAGLLLYPIVWTCCMTFLLPVSSTANCFAGGWGDLRAKDMILAGIGPTICGFFIAVLMSLIMSIMPLYNGGHIRLVY